MPFLFYYIKGKQELILNKSKSSEQVDEGQ